MMKICSCSAEIHKDLADVNLKLKLRLNGNTYLKSKAAKASAEFVERRRQHRIIFDDMDGSAAYVGSEIFHLELCKVGMFASSQTLASCAVPAMTGLVSAGKGPASTDLNLEFVALDTPGKVLANLTAHMSFSE
jgi:hypothetical protein